jgi:putative MFS transporter
MKIDDDFDHAKAISLPRGNSPGVEPSTSSYFDGLKLTRRHYIMFSLIILGTFFEQMDTYNMSFVGPALIKHWGLTMAQLAEINSVTTFAMLFGGLAGGYIADFYGRKKAILAGCLIFSTFSVCNGLAWNYYSFLTFRIITGIGMGVLISTEIGYVTEITPSDQRGKWYSIVLGVGLLGAPLVGLFSRIIIPNYDFGWRIVFFIGGLGLVIFILGIFFLKESPRWLISKQRYDKAKSNFKYLTGLELTINAEDVKKQKNLKKASYAEALRVMISKNYLRQTIVVSLTDFACVAAAFMFISWAPTLFAKNGMNLQTSLNIGFVISIGMPLGGIISSFITDKGGRKIPLGWSLLLYGILGIIFGELSNNTLIMVVGALMAACHIAFFSMTTSYASESYPTYVRGTSFAIIFILSRLGPAIGNLCVPLLFITVGYAMYFKVIGAILIAGGILVLVLGRPTAGHNLEDMHKAWHKK